MVLPRWVSQSVAYCPALKTKSLDSVNLKIASPSDRSVLDRNWAEILASGEVIGRN
jgi:hypothetical protein